MTCHDDPVEGFEPLEEPHDTKDADQAEHLDVGNAVYACELGDERENAHDDDHRVEDVLEMAPERAEVVVGLGENINQELKGEERGEDDLGKGKEGLQHILLDRSTGDLVFYAALRQQLSLPDVDCESEDDQNSDTVLSASVLVQISTLGPVVQEAVPMLLEHGLPASTCLCLADHFCQVISPVLHQSFAEAVRDGSAGMQDKARH